MGIQEMILSLMLTVFGGTSGNELLDYVDADIYFRSKGVEMKVETLMLEAKKPDVADTASAKEASVRRLLAIRALGNLKDKKALPVLNSFVDSKEMFVAGYAKRAIAKINGEAPKKVVSKNWKLDLPLLPKGSGVVVHSAMSPLEGKPGLMHRVAAMKEMKGIDEMTEEMKKGIVKEFFPIVDRIGNIRVDCFTIAVADNVGGNTGWVTGVVRGEYDKEALMNFINQEAADEMDLKKIGNTTYLMPDEHFAFGLQNNNLINFAAGPDEENLPLEEIQKAIDGKNEKLAFSEKLQKLIQRTEKKGNLWIAGLVTGEMLNVPFLKEFETVRLETELKDNNIHGVVIGEGKDADTVQKTMDTLEKLFTNFLENEFEDMKAQTPKQMKPMVNALETLRFRTREKNGIITFETPNVDPLMMMFGLFAYSSPVQMEIEEAELELKNEVEIKPMPLPVPAQ